jgi:hypothetical protein
MSKSLLTNSWPKLFLVSIFNCLWLQKCDDDDDEDLEALRLAALQTLGSNKPVTNSSNHLSSTLYQPQQISGLGRGFRGGMSYTQPGRNVSVWLDNASYFMRGLFHY